MVDSILDTFEYTEKELRQRKGFLVTYVLRRDRQCQCCGNTDGLEVHHIHPLYLGGEDEVNNMVALCAICHKNAPDNPDEFFEYQRRGGRTGEIRLISAFFNALIENDKCTIADFWQERIQSRLDLFDIFAAALPNEPVHKTKYEKIEAAKVKIEKVKRFFEENQKQWFKTQSVLDAVEGSTINHLQKLVEHGFLITDFVAAAKKGKPVRCYKFKR